MTFFFLKHGYKAPENSGSSKDGIVSGTTGDDTMPVGYTDSDGDQIDGNDGLNDTIDAGAGDDTINAGAGDDTVYAGSGSDKVSGGAGNDVIHGDSSLGTAEGGNTEVFQWDELPDPNSKGDIDNGDPLGGPVTQDTGSVEVTFETIATTRHPATKFSTDEQKVHSIDTGDLPEADKHSSLESRMDDNCESATYRWDFSQTVGNVSFRINDIDEDSKVTIKAFDGNGKPVELSADIGREIKGNDLDGSDGSLTVEAKECSSGSDTSPANSALITIPADVSYFTVTHEQNGNEISEVNITDIYFEPECPPAAGDGNDTLHGNDGDDVIYGEGGDDSITGGNGDDTIKGGFGDDTIEGGDGSDKVYGVGGNNVIDTSGPNAAFDNPLPIFTEDADKENDRDFVDGGWGNEVITTGDDRDTIYGNNGDDTINGGIDDDEIHGGAGNDSINDTQGSDTIWGDSGDDTIIAGIDVFSDYEHDDPNAIAAGYGSDPVTDDNIDVVYGGSGNDVISTGDDADTIYGGTGMDTIHGGIDDDYIDGGDDDDVITGGHGSDSILGGAGDDLINAGDSSLLWGQEPDATDPQPLNGRDTVDGGDGNDTIMGQDDNDLLMGGAGDDVIDGGIDQDTLMGGDGADTLSGGDGQDTVLGDGGNDLMQGNADEDFFTGVTYTGTGPGEGDHVDGGSAFTTGKDYDTLDLRGSAPKDGHLEVEYTSADREDGIVHYFDDKNTEVGKVTFEEIENIIPCFTPGTVIATPQGERLVEELQEGDRIITRDNGIQEIRWIGGTTLTGKQLAMNEHLKPVLIQKGALGHGLPERDMLVSPNHRMLVNNDKTALYFEEREVLVAAKHLTGVPGVDVVDTLRTTYIHFMFDRHEVVLSNGSWTESFQPGEQSLDGIGNAQRTEIFELFPELETTQGIRDYHAARRTLKKHEAKLLAD